MLSMSHISYNVISVIASQYPAKQRSSPISRFDQFCENHPKQNPPFRASNMHANERWVNPFISRSGAAVNYQGWVAQSPPISLSSTAELGCSEEKRQMASEHSVLQSKLSCVLLISSAASSACVSCISSPFTLPKSQAWKLIEYAYVRLSSLLTPKWNALWFVKCNHSAWKLMLLVL